MHDLVEQDLQRDARSVAPNRKLAGVHNSSAGSLSGNSQIRQKMAIIGEAT